MRKSNIHEAHALDATGTPTAVKKTCAIVRTCHMSPRQMHSRCYPTQAIVHGVTQKLEFYIHCCSTCHAFPRSHTNLDIAPHTLFIHAFGCARPFRRRTRRHTRHDSRSMCQGVCHQRDSGEVHAVHITSVALRDSASALAPSSPMRLERRFSSVMATLEWC